MYYYSCSLQLWSATLSVVSSGICHRNKVNSIARLYQAPCLKDSMITISTSKNTRENHEYRSNNIHFWDYRAVCSALCGHTQLLTGLNHTFNASSRILAPDNYCRELIGIIIWQTCLVDTSRAAIARQEVCWQHGGWTIVVSVLIWRWMIFNSRLFHCKKQRCIFLKLVHCLNFFITNFVLFYSCTCWKRSAIHICNIHVFWM